MGYRGSIMLKFKPTEFYHNRVRDSVDVYKVGDKVGQLIIIPYPDVTLLVSEELSSTERGNGGYGSTGN